MLVYFVLVKLNRNLGLRLAPLLLVSLLVEISLKAEILKRQKRGWCVNALRGIETFRVSDM